LTLNGRNAPYMFLKIIKKWCRPIKNPLINQVHKKMQFNLSKKLDSAKWFIDAIRQRQETLL
jgi:DNA-directed RNA polymerase specialized sigma54-like protein